MIVEKKKRVHLIDIVRKAVKRFELEFPVDMGWVDIFVPRHGNIKHPYAIGVETGYDFNCAKILQQNERFRKALTVRIPHVAVYPSVRGDEKIDDIEAIYPELCVVIPKDFVEFVPIFKAKHISVFVWEGELEWKCKKCVKSTFGRTFRKPPKCLNTSCNGKEKSLHLVGLKNFKIAVAYRVP